MTWNNITIDNSKVVAVVRLKKLGVIPQIWSYNLSKFQLPGLNSFWERKLILWNDLEPHTIDSSKVVAVVCFKNLGVIPEGLSYILSKFELPTSNSFWEIIIEYVF